MKLGACGCLAPPGTGRGSKVNEVF